MSFVSKFTALFFIVSCIFSTTTAQGGSWSPVINFPIIPVAAYIIPEYPESHRLMVISARQVAETQHDMFCPGISSLADGRLIITGGSNAERTSIYDPRSNAFTAGVNMQIARGYQSSTILSNGKVFTIGGSWSGALGNKTGEIYDPATNLWTLLPGAAVEPMLTYDHEGIFREDNHAWLHAWRNGSVFQGGPSKAR
jgi:galactose oxidase